MTMLAEAETEQEILADEIAAFTHDPLGYARFAFDWGYGELAGEDLRYWQGVVLGAIGDRLQDPATRHQPIRIAIASGHGVGKSALVGMVTKWALDTCVNTRIVVTANTDTQLRNKTWPEISKWARLAIRLSWRPTSSPSGWRRVDA